MKRRNLSFVLAMATAILLFSDTMPLISARDNQVSISEGTDTIVQNQSESYEIMALSETEQPTVSLGSSMYFVEKGETLQLDLQEEVIYCSWSSLNHAVVTVDSNGVVTGQSAGSGVIVAGCKLSTGHAVATCTVEVFEEADLEDGDYLLKLPGDLPYFLAYNDIEGAASPAELRELTVSDRDNEVIYLSRQSDGYYSILGGNRMFYLGTESNQFSQGMNVRFYSYAYIPATAVIRWKILKNDLGNYLLIPKGAESTNLVMSVPSFTYGSGLPSVEPYDPVGDQLFLAPYYIDSIEGCRTWDFFSNTVYVDYHYDASVSTKLSVIFSFPAVYDFVTGYGFNGMPVAVKNGKLSSRIEGMPADACEIQDSACTSACNTDPKKHCKDIKNMLAFTTGIPRENSHITLMWSDRMSGVYCDHSSLGATGAIAFAYQNQSCVQFLTLTSWEYIENGYAHTVTDAQVKVIMCLTTVHELAHIFGLPEVTNDKNHTPSEETEEVIYCAMKYNDVLTKTDFYYAILAEEYTSPFCSHCIADLNESMLETVCQGNM